MSDMNPSIFDWFLVLSCYCIFGVFVYIMIKNLPFRGV